jgi:16S rRNA (adenine1518-N6/adenine1519-N6)-dimethyltransferase
MDVSNIQNIKELCKELQILPKKSKGQNFLINRDILASIIEAANLQKTDTVLEIGPGLGILTEELIKRAGKVVAVEVDRKLFDYLQRKFAGVENLELVEGDVLKWQMANGKWQNYGVASRQIDYNYKIVANVPYQITAPILWKFLKEEENKPEEMVLMVQKEVGERICADRGEMSVLSVMAQYYSQPEIMRIVKNTNFWPAPEVDSAIVKFKIREKRAGVDEGLFFKLVKVGFQSKRKMLKNNLGNIYGQAKVEGVLEELGINKKVRAEELGVEEWILLVGKLGE